MEEFKTNLSKSVSSMPDPLAPFHEKILPEYGLKVAKAIQSEWFAGGFAFNNPDCIFSMRHQWIKTMREYNRGEQDPEQYKKHIYRNKGDEQLLNMDFNLINVVEKFTNVVRNGMSDEYYTLDIRSADPFSLTLKENQYLQHKKNMASREMLEKAKDLLGIDLTPKGFVPENDEEIRLYSEIKERPLQEIAEEIMIKYVKETSDWEYIKGETDKDVVVNDLMVARVFTDPINGVTVTYVDPETYGHSYVQRKDFKDAYYHFVAETTTINHLRKSGEFSDEQLLDIAKSYAAYNGYDFRANNNAVIPIDVAINFDIHVMHFCFYSDKEMAYKAYLDKNNEVSKVAKRDSTYTVPEGKEESKISQNLDTWLEGSYVIGSDKYIYDYKESENVERDEQDRAVAPFIVRSTNIYKNKLRSFLSNIIPAANQLQYFHLKIQHLAAELKPDIIELDIDGLAALSVDEKGIAKKDNWEKVLSVMGVKGVVFKKRVDMGEAGIKEARAASPQPTQQGSALRPLMNLWAHYYNHIRESTGINPAIDGTVNPDTLVGVNEMMKLAGNNATKHIVKASLEFDKAVCQVISTRIKGIFSQDEAKHLQQMYERAVGKQHIEAVKALKDRHQFDFGYQVEMTPTKQELDYLREDLSIAMQEGTIDVSEKSEIMRVAKSNIKIASQYMSFIRRRKIEERLREKQFDFQQQAENNSRLQQEQLEAKARLYAMQKQADLQYEAQSSVIKLQEHAQMKQIEVPYDQLKFQQQVYLESIKNLQTINLKKYDNDEKASRERDNSTRQSKMVEQRTKDLPAIDFSNEIDLDKLVA